MPDRRRSCTATATSPWSLVDPAQRLLLLGHPAACGRRHTSSRRVWPFQVFAARLLRPLGRTDVLTDAVALEFHEGRDYRGGRGQRVRWATALQCVIAARK